MSKLTHLDEAGAARMVDVSAKTPTERTATAEAFVRLSPEALAQATDGQAKKGDVFAAARIAGIMAAKRTSDLIPLCHPIALSSVALDVEPDAGGGAIRIRATAKTIGVTGVEMEALTAAAIAALTVYDMLKSVDRGMVVDGVRLLEKTGGRSGAYAPAATRQPNVASAAARPGRAVRARELMNEVGYVRAAAMPSSESRREALRRFMSERRLQATAWARDAGIPVAAIYSFLHGRTRELAADVQQKLAAAAGVEIAELFGPKR